MSSSDPEHDGGPDAEHPSTPEPDPLDVDNAFAAIVAGWADTPTTGSWPADEDLTSGRHRRVDDPVDRPRGSIFDATTSTESQPQGKHDQAQPDQPAKPDERDDEDPDDDSLALSGGPMLPSISGHGYHVERPEDEPEGFVPPEPPPIPRGDLITTLSWAGVIGGPLFLLITVIAWPHAPQLLVLTAVAGFVGGFIVLVSRMPKHRADDDDDGAVV